MYAAAVRDKNWTQRPLTVMKGDVYNPDNYTTVMVADNIEAEFIWRQFGRGIFYYYGLTLNPAWLSDYIHYKVWDEITYPFLNFNGATVEV